MLEKLISEMKEVYRQWEADTEPKTHKTKWQHDGMCSGFSIAIEIVERYEAPTNATGLYVVCYADPSRDSMGGDLPVQSHIYAESAGQAIKCTYDLAKAHLFTDCREAQRVAKLLTAPNPLILTLAEALEQEYTKVRDICAVNS